ncbi:hypothetical protein B7463_g11588, partial [Scytalidium lignicola]
MTNHPQKGCTCSASESFYDHSADISQLDITTGYMLNHHYSSSFTNDQPRVGASWNHMTDSVPEPRISENAASVGSVALPARAEPHSYSVDPQAQLVRHPGDDDTWLRSGTTTIQPPPPQLGRNDFEHGFLDPVGFDSSLGLDWAVLGGHMQPITGDTNDASATYSGAGGAMPMNHSSVPDVATSIWSGNALPNDFDFNWDSQAAAWSSNLDPISNNPNSCTSGLATYYGPNVAMPSSPVPIGPNPSRSIPSRDRRRHVCDYCGKSYARLDILLRHQRKHDDNASRHSCPFPNCTRVGRKGFLRLDKLRDHYRSKHRSALPEMQV